LAEYDALPELGHACGHNLIATAALGAALALYDLADDLKLEVLLLGTPAEERGAGKVLMAQAGAFQGVEAALMIHPAPYNLPVMLSLATAELWVSYHGRPAHAAAAPWEGINALDALVMAYQGLGYLRQHIRSEERVHGVIIEGGQTPNIVPERASGRFYIRSTDARGLQALKARVEACFQAGAQATGARLELRWGDNDYLEIWNNGPLSRCFQRHIEALGRKPEPFKELRGSTDLGNISQRLPAIHPMLALTEANPLSRAPYGLHTRAFAEAAGSTAGEVLALDGALALALTALEYSEDEALRVAVQREFLARCSSS